MCILFIAESPVFKIAVMPNVAYACNPNTLGFEARLRYTASYQARQGHII